MLVGYSHPLYVQSFLNIGIPWELTKCEGWILRRQIPKTSYFDAMACYPLFCCNNWSNLKSDIEDLGEQLVCLSLVADPFGEYDFHYLKQCFKDIVIPFKQHFVMDLNLPIDSYISKHHIRNIKKSLKSIFVENCKEPINHAEEWVSLYQNLITKRQIKGIATFSPLTLCQQLQVPGIVMFRALYDSLTVGINLWYVYGDVAYYHLGALSNIGYDIKASYGLIWSAVEYFSELKLKWINLGGGAGINNEGTDGLTLFKRRWSSGTKTTYFCGRVFQPQIYADINLMTGNQCNNYFPSYRSGEFR